MTQEAREIYEKCNETHGFLMLCDIIRDHPGALKNTSMTFKGLLHPGALGNIPGRP